MRRINAGDLIRFGDVIAQDGPGGVLHPRSPRWMIVSPNRSVYETGVIAIFLGDRTRGPFGGLASLTGRNLMADFLLIEAGDE